MSRYMPSGFLLAKLASSLKDMLGISFKTQALYVGIFSTRYLDLFFRWTSFYNTSMKVIFIGSSCYILYLMKYRYRCIMILLFRSLILTPSQYS